MAIPALLEQAGYQLTMSGAVEFTGFHRNTIGKAAASGLIPDAKSFGGRWFFTRDGLLQWVLSDGGDVEEATA